MANMPDITKRQVSTRLDIELCRKVEKEFTRTGDKSKGLAYVRALEEATREIVLDDADYEIIAEEIRQNKVKREGGKA